MNGQTVITPNVNPYLVIDVTEPLQTRPEWHIIRSGNQISRVSKAGANVSSNVSLQLGGGWTLAPHEDDLTRITSSNYSNTVVGAADVNLAGGWLTQNTYQKPTETGIGASGSLISTGVPAFTKRVSAAGSWDTELSADLSALPKPALPTADIPMNRVLSSVRTYAENAGFALNIVVPPDSIGQDTLLNFYFGGPAQTGTSGKVGGQFCLTLRGSGEALLQEFDGVTPWAVRKRFRWIGGEHIGSLGVYTVWIFPYARNTIAIRTVDTAISPADSIFGIGTAINTATTLALAPSQITRGGTYYRSVASNTGYTPGPYMTGAGQIRLDVRRDLRPLITIVHLSPPLAGGTLVDAPFWIPFPIPAGTALTLTQAAVTPKDSTLVASLYDATTHAALTPVGTNKWQSNGGQQLYYAKFGYTPDSLIEQTPTLWAYEVQVAPASVVSRSGTSVVIPLQGLSITGPDLDPTHDTASCNLQDPADSNSLLRTRARMHSRINSYSDLGALNSVLFEGEIQRANAGYKGHAGSAWPLPSWREYDVTMTGMWARLADQVNLCLRFYTDDGSGNPWRITAIIRDLLAVAGFPPYMIDVPEQDIRLQPVDSSGANDLVLQPGSSIADFVLKLARDYLGAVLLWDPNAGITPGMWRLIPNPGLNPSTFLWSFLDSPGPGLLATHPSSYATGTTFIAKVDGRSTFSSYIAPPEANFIQVVGTGGPGPSGTGASQKSIVLYNAKSFNFTGPTSDPTSPDYLGRFVPVVYVDSTLQDDASMAFVARRLYDQIAHAQKWIQFSAPLVLLSPAMTGDPLQTLYRPLRVNDPVYVLGVPCLVRSCNPDTSGPGSAAKMMAHYECLALA